MSDGKVVCVVATREAAAALAQTERLFDVKHVTVHYMG
jgi:hypothetical protein